MQLTTFLSASFTILGLAAASPVEDPIQGNTNLAFINKRACDCPGIQNCCKECLQGDGGEECCNTTCMDKFPGCYLAC